MVDEELQNRYLEVESSLVANGKEMDPVSANGVFKIQTHVSQLKLEVEWTDILGKTLFLMLPSHSKSPPSTGIL